MSSSVTFYNPNSTSGARQVPGEHAEVCDLCFGALSEGPGVCGTLRDRTLLMALGVRRWGHGNWTVPDPWGLVIRQGPNGHQGLSIEWGALPNGGSPTQQELRGMWTGVGG